MLRGDLVASELLDSFLCTMVLLVKGFAMHGEG